MQPADFYTGLVADLYSPLKGASYDPEPYAAFIREQGEPALELGCGDGDPLIELRRRGLDVDGVDSSADMLERCRWRADQAGVDVRVHCQRMEELDLSRRYTSIFLAGPTFTLLADDATALAALRRIRAHLREGGVALVPLAVPEPTPAERIGQARVAGVDGAELRVSVVAEERDEHARVQRSMLRYERLRDGERTVQEQPWVLHWYTRAGFEELVGQAGLRVASVTGPDGGPAGPEETDVSFLLWAG